MNVHTYCRMTLHTDILISRILFIDSQGSRELSILLIKFKFKTFLVNYIVISLFFLIFQVYFILNKNFIQILLNLFVNIPIFL